MQLSILSVAGSDCSGGAGIQADIRTAQLLDVYAATVVTAVTVQNSQGVSQIEVMSPSLVASQMQAVLADRPVAAIKIGMTASHKVIEAILGVLADCASIPVIFDPVMRASAGGALFEEDGDAFSFMKTLVARSDVSTPNIKEAEILSGVTISDQQTMVEAGRAIKALGVENVIITGSHLQFDHGAIRHALITKDKVEFIDTPRIEGGDIHGTGCMFSTALACSLAKGHAICQAIDQANQFVAAQILLQMNILTK